MITLNGEVVIDENGIENDELLECLYWATVEEARYCPYCGAKWRGCEC